MVTDRLRRVERTEALVIGAVLFLGLMTVGIASQVSPLSAGNQSDDMVAHYRFAEGAGDTLYDVSGNDNDGVIEGANWSTDCVTERCMSFDGEGDYVEVPSDSSLDIEENITLSAWVYGDEWRESNYDRAFVMDRDGRNGYGLQIYGVYQNVNFWINGDIVATENNVLNDHEWNHIAAVYNGTHAQVFSNGERVDIAELDETISSSGSLQLSSGRTYERFNGSIADARLYSSALSEDEIELLYQNHGASARVGASRDEPDGTVLDIDFQRRNDTHVYDLSGQQNHGSIYGSPEQQGAVHCVKGRCFDFDGENDYVDTAEVGISGDDPRTIMGWVRSEDTSQADWTQVFGFVGGPTDDQYFDIQVESGSYCSSRGYVIHVHGDAWCIESGWDSAWHHIAATYNGSHIRAYYDGKKTVEVEHSPLSTVDDIQVGKRNDFENYFEGMIDQIKVFDEALTQQEIVQEAGLDSDGAVLDLRFDEGAGDTVYDRSMHENHGELVPGRDMPTWSEDCLTDSCLVFDGEDDYVQVSDDESLNVQNGSWTVTGWVRQDNDRREAIMTVPGSFWFFVEDDGQLGLQQGDSPWDGVWPAPGDELETGRWHHVAAVQDTDDTVTLYKDGESVADASVSLNTSTSDAYIATWDGTERNWTGAIDDVRIYPYALSDDKVQELYDRGSTRVGSTDRQEQDPDSPDKDDDLVLHHGFTERNDTHVFDRSGYMNHGRVTGGSLTAQSSVTCITGRCITFNGTGGGSIEGSAEELEGTDEFTFMFWLKPDEGHDYHKPFVFGSTSGEDEERFEMYLKEDPGYAPNEDYLLWSAVDVLEGESVGQYTYEIGEWRHHTVRYNGSELRAYRDGQLVDIQETSGTFDVPDSVLGVGGDQWGGSIINGSMDDVRVYNRSLSEEEIWHVYSEGRDRNTRGEMAGPNAWWRLDAGQGMNVFDHSGEGVDGWLEGVDTVVAFVDRVSARSDWNEGSFERTSADRDAHSGDLGIGYRDGVAGDDLIGYWRFDDVYEPPTDLGEDEVLEDFEHNDLSGTYSGDTGAFQIADDRNFEDGGSYALYGNDDSGGDAYRIITDTGTQVSQGDTLSFQKYVPEQGNDGVGVHFGVQDEVGADNIESYEAWVENGYLALYRFDGGTGTYELLDYITGFTLPSDAWFDIRVEWEDDGTMTLTVHSPSGAEIESVSASDTAYSSGGIGWSYYYEGSVWYADYLVTNPDADPGHPDVRDHSGEEHHGGNLGATTDEQGVFGTDAYHFDADEDQYVDVASDPDLNTDAVTVAAWINFDSLDDTTRGIVTRGSGLGAEEGNDAYGPWAISYWYDDESFDGPQIFFDAYTDYDTRHTSDTRGTVWDGAFETDTWYHVVGTYEPGTGGALYINGTQIDTSWESGSLLDDDKDIGIGEDLYDASTGSFNGTIDEVKVFDRALSEDEVEDLYRQGMDGVFEGNYTSDTLDAEVVTMWTSVSVNASVPPGTEVSAEFRAVDSGGSVLDAQTASIQDGAYNYTLDLQDSEQFQAVFDGNTTDPEETWEVHEYSVYMEDPEDLWMDEDCVMDGCAVFDGDSEWVNAAPDDFGPDDEFTVSAWAWREPGFDPDTNWYGVVSKWEQDQVSDSEWFMGMHQNSYSYWLSTEDSYVDLDTDTPIPEGEWIHMAMTYDGSDFRGYADGDVIASQSISGTVNDGIHPVMIGKNEPAYYWDGKIDDVRIYPYALTADQVKQVKDSGSARIG